ncbi:MAG: glucose-6-phosphate isomerase [Bacteroidales bacterium]|jgi:glucose-6-phosphate isomerase|nr:glucose-6-phosphate isomerase [Bacteroidales bacterium]
MKLNISKVTGFVPEGKIYANKQSALEHVKALYEKTGKGNDFLGWVRLPSSVEESELSAIEDVAAFYRQQKVEIVVVAGIGGSYLGAKATLEALSDNFWQMKDSEYPKIIFAGQNISEDYLYELLDLLETRSYGVVVISKSGTTTEPAVAFRLLKAHLEKKVGKAKAKDYIVAVTDGKRGALRTLAAQEGYRTFVIPDDVGGRYSVLTPVGLLPIAIAGFDVRQLIQGAADMQQATAPGVAFEENIAAIYAATRYELYRAGKTTEILAGYHPKLLYVAEWWKQLYGESEGKENKGIFPASVTLTADLHSMGQYIQEGLRNIFETVISVERTAHKLRIPPDTANLDTLNFLSDKRIDEVNKMAELGTMLAHVDGGVPNIRIEIPAINEYNLGKLFYFFEIACGISGYLLGVNPFDQPGVEAYKKNMFALLDKPGYEEESRKVKVRLQQ